jgi:hypothetical protein
MFITDTPLPEPVERHRFPETITITYYICSEGFHGKDPKHAYYIGVEDCSTNLYNRHGDFLYDVTGIHPWTVMQNIMDRTMYNWKIYSNKPQNRKPYQDVARAPSWGSEILHKYAGNVTLWLIHCRPNTTLSEAKFILANEGYLIDDSGFLIPDPTKQQI